MTTHAEATHRIARSRTEPRNSRASAAGFVAILAAWAERRRQRLSLARLDDTMLRDIGLSRADVEGEAGKPFWMV